MIVQKDRVAAAACFLPLTTSPTLARELGTRHRAAIGITEETDCLSMVVSEETGRISVAAFGELVQGLSAWARSGNASIAISKPGIRYRMQIDESPADIPLAQAPGAARSRADRAAAHREGEPAMKRAKWLLGLVTHNFGWKMLSLAIAVVIWALVASEPEISTFATRAGGVQEPARGPGDQLRPVTTVKLELRGPSGELRGAGRRRRAPRGDSGHVAACRPGERTFPIGDGNVRLARGVHLVRAIPSEVRFHFERTRRSAP